MPSTAFAVIEPATRKEIILLYLPESKRLLVARAASTRHVRLYEAAPAGSYIGPDSQTKNSASKWSSVVFGNVYGAEGMIYWDGTKFQLFELGD